MHGVGMVLVVIDSQLAESERCKEKYAEKCQAKNHEACTARKVCGSTKKSVV